MIRLTTWQWVVLAAPILAVVLFLLIAAGVQIHAWHLSWVWAVFGLSFVVWRWLLVKWTQPARAELDELVAEIAADLPQAPAMPTANGATNTPSMQVEAVLQEILLESRSDPPVWADWNAFWRRCLSLISAIAPIYKPNAKQPLLNIYVPEAYRLLRGTIDDMDEWLDRMSPVLNQVTIEQALQAYEIYQKLQPTARKMLQAWGWARWLLNPIAAAANVATKGTRTKATQELLGNFNQLARETVLRNLAQQAVLLYGGQPESSPSSKSATATAAQQPASSQSTASPSTAAAQPTTLKSAQPTDVERDLASSTATTAAIDRDRVAKNPQMQSIQDLFLQASPPAQIAQRPVNLLLVGRTGAGKSSLINTLFVQPMATVDALPSTDGLKDYQWQAPTGESLILWDTPGYEQVGQNRLREIVIQQAQQVDVMMLVMPALDPALQMDVDFLRELNAAASDLPIIGVMTQVDRLRPLREWQPPYDWQMGSRPKEVNMREALDYRAQTLPSMELILPLVNQAEALDAWGVDALSTAILQVLEPAKQQRLARFFQSLSARTVAATDLIDRYTLQMTTQQGLAAFLKSPVLQFISTLSTGNPSLALVLAEQIPIEQLPLVIGKAQLAYELYNLVQPLNGFELTAIWPLLIDQRDRPDRNAKAFGYALIEYWAKSLSAEQLFTNFKQSLQP